MKKDKTLKIKSLYKPIIATLGGKRYVCGNKLVEIEPHITMENIEWERQYPIGFRLNDTYVSRTLAMVSGGNVVATIIGSKGDTYKIKENNGKYNCNCKGYTFNSKCKHLTNFVSERE